MILREWDLICADWAIIFTHKIISGTTFHVQHVWTEVIAFYVQYMYISCYKKCRIRSPVSYSEEAPMALLSLLQSVTSKIDKILEWPRKEMMISMQNLQQSTSSRIIQIQP